MSLRLSFRPIALVAVAVLISPSVAFAASKTSNMTVSASVAQECSIVASPLAFGTYLALTTNATSPLDANTTIDVTCTKGSGSPTAVTLDLGNGLNTGVACTGGPARCMKSGSNYLAYDLFSDSYTTPWVSGTPVTLSPANWGTTNADHVSVYGRIAAGLDAAVGANYADTVVATVNF